MLDLQLIPMQLISATPIEETSGSDELVVTSPTTKNLVVYPGEPTEMVVQLENRSSRSLRWNAQVQGKFPPDWCQILNHSGLLAPGDRVNSVLLFQIPQNFFEEDAMATFPLTLDYDARLNIYGTDSPIEEEEPPAEDSTEILSGELVTSELFTLLQFANFQIFIRPQSLYRDFVPRIFSEIDFLGRFLKIFEQAFEPDVRMLDTLWAYLDPMLAPESLLPFLAHWVGWPVQPNLSLNQQRPLIRNALQLYRWRGTRRGLRFALHLATGLPLVENPNSEDQQPIGIYESFSRGLVLGDTYLGQDATFGGGRPYHFTVRLRPPQGYRLDQTLIQTVIEQEKPAFCTYDLVIEPSESSA